MSLTIRDADHELRCMIETDGAVRDAQGKVLGFINNDGSAGDSNEEFLGEINQGCQVLDNKDEVIGSVDLGKAELRDGSGSHLASFSSSGEVRDHVGSTVARIENFTFHQLKRVAAYIFYFDTALVRVGAPTKIEAPVRSPRAAAPVSPRGEVDTSSLGGAGFDVDVQAREEARLLKHLGGRAGASQPAAKPVETKPAAPKPAEPVKKVEQSEWKPTAPISAETNDQGLQVGGSGAREEERFSKMFNSMTVVDKERYPNEPTGPIHITHNSPSASHPVPVTAQTGTAFESELWLEVNRARTDPAQMIKYLQEMKPNFISNNNYRYPGTNNVRKTVEGVEAVDEAIAFLQKQRPLSQLTLSPGLSNSCRDLCLLGATGKDLNTVESQSEAETRLAKYGNFSGRLFQNISLGNLPPKEVVASWIIDDGNKKRDHRESLFDAAVVVAGVSSGPHTAFARIVVAAFTGRYYESSDENPGVAVFVAPPDAPEVEQETEWKVGGWSEMTDRYFVTVENLGCPAKALSLRLVKDGIQLDLTRKITFNKEVKQAIQRLSLPMPFKADQVSAEYSVGRGKLTVNFKKGGAAPAATSGPVEVANFVVPADASKTNDKVEIKPQQAGEYFAFSCETSKYQTNVVGTLEGRKLSFGMTYSFDATVDGEEVTKTIKLTSAFTLPFDVSVEQVEVTPNPGKGQTLKVYKTKPAAGSAPAGGSQPDVDINILSKS